MSNKEIAQTLFITIKTVEVHLSHAYREARDQLPRPTRQGPPDSRAGPDARLRLVARGPTLGRGRTARRGEVGGHLRCESAPPARRIGAMRTTSRMAQPAVSHIRTFQAARHGLGGPRARRNPAQLPRPRRELRRRSAPRPQPVVVHGRVVSRVSRSSLPRKAKRSTRMNETTSTNHSLATPAPAPCARSGSR